MKITVAAAGPNGPTEEDVLACIRHAREKDAVLLVLPGRSPEISDLTAIRRAAGPMPVYPYTAASLTAEGLKAPPDLDILCCSVDGSVPWLLDTVITTSRERDAIVLAASSQMCVIAQGGTVLDRSRTFALAEVTDDALKKR